MAISIISVSSDSSKKSVGTSTGRVILFGTIPTTIPDTTLSMIPPSTHVDTTPIPIISSTIPPSPDYTPTLPNYTPALPDYSPASDMKSDPSEDPVGYGMAVTVFSNNGKKVVVFAGVPRQRDHLNAIQESLKPLQGNGGGKDVSTTMIIQPGPVVDFLINNQNVKDPYDILEKLRPEKELELILRIFCSTRAQTDVRLDNDIILCDGACDHGFRQFCLYPPLLKEQAERLVELHISIIGTHNFQQHHPMYKFSVLDGTFGNHLKYDDIYGIGLDTPLPQVVIKWKALEGKSGFYQSGCSETTQLSMFGGR
nr:homeobox protein HAT3.1-like isoform X1 [Tanacetum cinerariifolium]